MCRFAPLILLLLQNIELTVILKLRDVMAISLFLMTKNAYFKKPLVIYFLEKLLDLLFRLETLIVIVPLNSQLRIISLKVSATKISTTPNRLDMYRSQQKAILTQKQPEIHNGLP